jgi:hypothetical protein
MSKVCIRTVIALAILKPKVGWDITNPRIYFVDSETRVEIGQWGN